MIIIYWIGFCTTLIAGIIFAAMIADDFWEDFLAMIVCVFLGAFLWPLLLVLAIVILILRGIWLLIRAEDLHKNIWEWVKKVWTINYENHKM